ncbi:hypothetical protein MJO28_016923, partial [Puccinia striiformis f. sp. tritici]
MAANTSKSSSNNQVVYSAGRSTKGQGNTEENLPSTKKNLTPRSETSTHAAKFTFQTTGPQFPKTPSARFPWSCTLPALGQPASALQYSCFSEAPNTDLVRVHGHIGVSVTGKTWAELIKLCMAYAFLIPFPPTSQRKCIRCDGFCSVHSTHQGGCGPNVIRRPQSTSHLQYTWSLVIRDPTTYKQQGWSKKLLSEDSTFMITLLRKEPGLFLDEIQEKVYDGTGVLLTLQKKLHILDRICPTCHRI